MKMKNVLSLLVSFVLVQTQCWALSGGPKYKGSVGAVVGTYAGVLIPSGIGSNAVGLFSVGVPETSLASGSFAMFSGGGTFYGTVLGMVDPEKQTIVCVCEGTQSVKRTYTDVLGVAATSTQLVATGSGGFNAKLSTAGNGKGSRLRGAGSLSTSSINNSLSSSYYSYYYDYYYGGNANSFTPGETVNFVVDGFKQSNSATGTLNTLALTGGIPAATGATGTGQ